MNHKPGPDTVKSLTDRISFFQSGAAHYEMCGDRNMAEWSRQMMRQAMGLLEELKGEKREPGEGE